jgi:S-disulfanyl-L-cysteine oxidoreductase SoxD
MAQSQMFMFKKSILALALIPVVSACAQSATVQRYGIGRAPTAAEIAGWNIDVRADGAGLPAASGSVRQGRAIYEDKCAACHGAKGEGGPAPRLAGGYGTLTSVNPVLSVGSFWPYASTLYDYINRAMPFDRPQSLTPSQVYAVTAYTLRLNDIVGDDGVLDKFNLPGIEMPNRKGFSSPDPRPDTHQ